MVDLDGFPNFFRRLIGVSGFHHLDQLLTNDASILIGDGKGSVEEVLLTGVSWEHGLGIFDFIELLGLVFQVASLLCKVNMVLLRHHFFVVISIQDVGILNLEGIAVFTFNRVSLD